MGAQGASIRSLERGEENCEALQCAAIMGEKTPHHVWPFSLLAWVALVVIPTAFISISWLLGIRTDSSVPNVFDLLPFALLFSVPAAFVAFALLAPLAIATDRALRGRTPRLLNIMLGGALG